MLAIVSVLVTFLSLVQNTRHPQIKGGEFYFGFPFSPWLASSKEDSVTYGYFGRKAACLRTGGKQKKGKAGEGNALLQIMLPEN